MDQVVKCAIVAVVNDEEILAKKRTNFRIHTSWEHQCPVSIGEVGDDVSITDCSLNCLLGSFWPIE